MMKHSLAVCLGIFLSALSCRDSAAAEWSPPEKPDPAQILQEANTDTRAGRFEDALTKHIWYHRNALKHSPAQQGVRLSFALSYWYELATKYPPAMTALKEERDEAKRKALVEEDIQTPFQEFVAFNRQLNDDAATLSLFAEIEKKRSDRTEATYPLAEPALIRAKDYDTCGKYVDPEAFTAAYERLRRSKQPESDPRVREFEIKRFRNRSCTIVALLVLNKRDYEAKTIAEQAKKELRDDEFIRDLDDSLKGTVPAPWP